MITEAEFEIIRDKVMALLGMRRDCHSTFIAENAEAGWTTYIGFISDGSETDHLNGRVLADYLSSKSCEYSQRLSRSMVVYNTDLVRLFLPQPDKVKVIAEEQIAMETILAKLIKDTAAAREASWDGAKYQLDMREAAEKVCVDHPILATPVWLLLYSCWNDALEWAGEQSK